MESQPNSLEEVAPGEAAKKPKTGLIISIAAAAIILCCVCLIAAVVIVLIVNPDLLSSLFGAKWSTAKIMPADTGAYFAFDLDVRNAAGYQHLVEVYGDVWEDEMRDQFEESLDEFDMTFADDIEPWLGTEIGMGITNMQDVMESNEQPIVVIVVENRDRAAAEAFLQKYREGLEDQDYNVEEETYQEVTYYVQESEYDWETTYSFGLVGKYVVFAADPDVMEDVIDLERGEGDPLSENENFTGLLDVLPRDATVISYYDAQSLMEAATESSGLNIEFECGNTGEMMEAYRAFGIAATLNEEGIQLDFTMTLDPEALSQETLESYQQAAVSAPTQVLQQVPDDSLGLMAFTIPDNAWENYQATLDECPDLEEQLEDMGDSIGIDLDTEFLSWITGEMGIAVVEAQGAGEYSSPIGVFAILQTPDLEGAMDAMDELAEAMAESQGAEFEEEEIGGVEMQVLVDPYSEDITFGYGATDQHLVVGYTEDALEAAVSDGDSIVDSETFQGVQAHMPRDSVMTLYVNVEGIWQLIYDSMSEYEQDSFDESTRPYLEPIKAVAMGAAQGDIRDGCVTATLFIYIP